MEIFFPIDNIFHEPIWYLSLNHIEDECADTLFTFCPPGFEDLIPLNLIADSSM